MQPQGLNLLKRGGGEGGWGWEGARKGVGIEKGHYTENLTLLHSK